KLIEGNSYIGELSGKPKEKESIFGILRSFGILRKHYGKVAVNFGEPILLDHLLDDLVPDWRNAAGQVDEKPAWFNNAVDTLAEEIQVNVNRAADVNPINLLAVALLSTPKYAMAESDLLAQLVLSKKMLAALPYSDRVTAAPPATFSTMPAA